MPRERTKGGEGEEKRGMGAMVRLRSRSLHLLLICASFALFLFFVDHRRFESSESSAPVVTRSPFEDLSNEADAAALLSQVFISVKTTERFHQTRADLIVKTWFKLAPDNVFFFSDADDASLSARTNGHLIKTNCSSSHNRKALCCKMSVELETFLRSQAFKWFCHFDDDNYVNVPRLVELLQSYSPQDDWYLGKPSIRAPLQILDRKSGAKIGFWFATGGAGFCLSRSLVLKMIPSGRLVGLSSLPLRLASLRLMRHPCC